MDEAATKLNAKLQAENLQLRHGNIALRERLKELEAMDKDLDAKLYAAVLHTITVLHFERLNTEQRAYLAGAIVREIELRKIV